MTEAKIQSSDPTSPSVFYAHTLVNRPPEDWQKLSDHLMGVAERAAGFGREFQAEDWARIAGYLHDLGKYSEAFQSYLRSASAEDPHVAECASRVDHSTAGAQQAVADFGLLGHLLAFPIAGHHSGLLDAISDGACLESRLNKEVEPWQHAPDTVVGNPCPKPPPFVRTALGRHNAFSVAFFVRMVFSCLVDADYLDTEAFMDPGKAAERPIWLVDVFARMERSLDDHVAGFQPEANEVNDQRARVREACLQAAERSPGFFSLTVPTGGGKTLSSLAFALRHIRCHGMKRIIYVVPFTSIIEQNAGIFRKVAAPLTESGLPDPVIEHHGSLDPVAESAASRLATENWDAPLIVTTAVQFYESLFANRTSRCRKLHNLADSVIILDEAQAIPVDLLEPCLRALDELQSNYGATVVLCTATQPAIHRRNDFPIGLELPIDHEIVPDPGRLYQKLKRVEVEREPTLTDEELTARLLEEDQVLCVVNTRRHARRLAELLGQGESHFQLSALMCAAHRSERIRAIHRRLGSGASCRVISTRLIEAGVDIDFPVVYRTMAGLDSIAQAAGRCNRNGKLPTGRVVVFEPEDAAAERFLSDTANCAKQVLPLYEDPLSLEAVEHYFRLYYWDQSARWDSKQILDEFHFDQNPKLPFLFGFARVGSRFNLIEETGRSVIIPWESEGERLCEELRKPWVVPSVRLLRRLQRFTVQIPHRVWNEHWDTAFELVHDQYPVLAFPKEHYSAEYGLKLENDPSGLLIT